MTTAEKNARAALATAESTLATLEHNRRFCVGDEDFDALDAKIARAKWELTEARIAVGAYL
jgi:hypothetical protein